MVGSWWDTPLLADRRDCPMTGSVWDAPSLADRGDAPMTGVRIDNVLTPLVFIDRFIGEHGW